MSHHPDSDPPGIPRRPGLYSQHESLATSREEPTVRTRLGVRDRVSKEDFEVIERHVRTVSRSDFPPKKEHPARQIVLSVLAALIVAGAAAAANIWRNDAVAQTQQAETDRDLARVNARVDTLAKDEREHEHGDAQTTAAIRELAAEVRQQNGRLERIEHQLDQQRRPR